MSHSYHFNSPGCWPAAEITTRRYTVRFWNNCSYHDFRGGLSAITPIHDVPRYLSNWYYGEYYCVGWACEMFNWHTRSSKLHKPSRYIVQRRVVVSLPQPCQCFQYRIIVVPTRFDQYLAPKIHQDWPGCDSNWWNCLYLTCHTTHVTHELFGVPVAEGFIRHCEYGDPTDKVLPRWCSRFIYTSSLHEYAAVVTTQQRM